MHKLQIPAVTRPTKQEISQSARDLFRGCCILPQTTLTLPPEGKLSERLADNAVQDCRTQLSAVNSSRSQMISTGWIHTFRIAKARPSMDLKIATPWSVLQLDPNISKTDTHTATRNAASAQPCGPSEPTGHHRQGIFSP